MKAISLTRFLLGPEKTKKNVNIVHLHCKNLASKVLQVIVYKVTHELAIKQ